MKLKVQKLQQGGTVPPFVSWTPVPDTPIVQPEQAVQKGSAAASEDEGLLSKEMVKLLLENGLPSDVTIFTNQLQSLYNDPSYRKTGNINNSQLSNQYLNIISKINNIRFGKEQYENNLKTLTSNGGINDIAITETGRLIVQDADGQIDQITPNEYYENLGEYRVITNSELAHMRATNPNLAFNDSIFSILNNGIGSETIQQYINSAVQNLGTTTQKLEGFVSKREGDILQGVQELYENPEIQEALLSNGVYKVSKESKTQLQQSEAALRYLYSTLPENAKSYLKGKAAVNGLDPQTGIQTILTQLLLSRQSATSNLGIGYESQLSKDTGITGTEERGRDNISQAQTLQNGVTNDYRNVTINQGTNTQFTVTNAKHWNTILNSKDNSPMTNISVEDLMGESSLATAGDQNSYYLGRQKVGIEDAAKLIVDTSKGITKVTLPYRINPADGSIMPAHDIIYDIEQAEKEIRETPGMTPQEKKNIYAERGIEEYYGLTDNPNLLTQRNLGHDFYVVNVVGSTADDVINAETAVDNETGLQYLHKLSKDEKNKWAPFINDVINSDIKKTDSKYKYDVTDRWYQFWRSNDIYSGNLFIADSRDRITTGQTAKTLSVPKSVNELDYVERRGYAQNNPVISSLDSLNY